MTNISEFTAYFNRMHRMKLRTEVKPGFGYISIHPNGKLCWWLCKSIINKNECIVEWFIYLNESGEHWDFPNPEEHKTIVHNGKVLYAKYHSLFNEKPPKTYCDGSVVNKLAYSVYQFLGMITYFFLITFFKSKKK